MNKITYLKLTALLVINIFINCSIHNYQKIDDDYLILNYIMVKNNFNKTSLKEENDNSYTINILKKLKKNYDDSIKKDSLNQIYGIKNDSVLSQLFNYENLNYFISQKDKKYWDINKINNIKIKNSSPNELNRIVFISKPIYTKKRDFSIVNVSNKNKNFILVLKKNNNYWEEYKIIVALIK